MPRTVPVVEDHASTSRALGIILRLLDGREVRHAAAAAEALGRLSPPPGAALIDLALPDGPGEAVVRAVHAACPAADATGATRPKAATIDAIAPRVTMASRNVGAALRKLIAGGVAPA